MDENERLADPIDRATRQEEEDRAQAIAAQLRSIQSTETPDEDADGVRYCLDCGDVIPPERIVAVREALRIEVVRCVRHAALRERQQQLRSQPGGFSQFNRNDY